MTTGKPVEEDVMQHLRNVGAAVMLGVVVAACGGGSPTQAPAATQSGGGGGGGGSATDQPAATQSGGGGNGGVGGVGGDPSKGTGHVEISGPATKSMDLVFSPMLSHFGGTAETVLYLTPTNGEGALALTWDDGVLTATFTGTDVVVTGSECTTTSLKIEAASASGQFACPTNIVVLSTGASAQNAGFSGTFDVKG